MVRFTHVPVLIVIFALTYSVGLTFQYLGQPLLDLHSFRQTQTAITSFWFLQEGFSLNYQTPVLGYPWEIPFEFPFYQLLVSIFSDLTGLSLDYTGRLTSYLFLLASLVPIWFVIKKLALRKNVFWFFAVLYLLNPVYLYWGRAFMIETAALFFIIATLPFFADLYNGKRNFSILAGFSIFATFAVLQKVTTAVPVLLVLSVVLIFKIYLEKRTIKSLFSADLLVIGLLGFLMPVAIGYLWTDFTDQMKMLNPIGTQLTSHSLSEWNWGTITQKLDPEVYRTVVWERMLGSELLGTISLFTILVGLGFAKTGFNRVFVFVLLLLAILPVLLFTNLHYEHSYYQVAAIIFYLMALAYTIEYAFPHKALAVWLKVAVVVIFALLSVLQFQQRHWPYMVKEFTASNHSVLAMTDILKKHLTKDDGFIAFGLDWHAGLAYYAQRKALMVPSWMPNDELNWDNPELLLGEKNIGALVSCLNKDNKTYIPSVVSNLEFKASHRYQVGNCQIFIAKKDV